MDRLVYTKALLGTPRTFGFFIDDKVVNTTLTGGPELPFGGFKQSGWGREAGSYGTEEYTQIKSVHIEIGKRQHWVR